MHDRLEFDRRRDRHLPLLSGLFQQLYGSDVAAQEQFLLLLADLEQSWVDRDGALRELDEEREGDPDWFQSNRMLGAVCDADRFAGGLAGIRARVPYFVELGLSCLHLMSPPSARVGGAADDGASAAAVSGVGVEADGGDLDPAIDTTDELTALAADLRADGISLGLDFVLTRRDLDYREPAAFRAVAGELLLLANRGAEILRMVSVGGEHFGAGDEALPDPHLLVRAFNTICRIAAPAVLFAAEATGRPDDLVDRLGPDECRLGGNSLQMALIWNTLATREVRLLAQALRERHALPSGAAWIVYLRDDDAIDWAYAVEDAVRLGIDGEAHHRFLTEFFTGRFPGSFARGLEIDEGPDGDGRVAGSTASLAGLEAGDPLAVARILAAHAVIMSTGGIPMLYLGDEVGQLNDYSFRNDPALADDPRWAGRPWFPLEAYMQRGDPGSSPGGVFNGMRRLIQVRRTTTEFAGNELVGFDAKNPHVLGYLRPGLESVVLVLINVADQPQRVAAEVLSGMTGDATELLSGRQHPHSAELLLAPMAVVWLRYQL